MKKRRNIIIFTCVLFFAYIIISIFTFMKSNQLIEEGFLSSEGNAAENFAVLTAANIHLTDARVSQLKSLSYSELIQAEENQSLRKMMGEGHFANKVDYAYVMVHLPEMEIKYAVDEESQALFNAPPGTPLDIMWLLDVTPSESASEVIENSEVDGLSDLRRYSYYIPEDDKIFNMEPSYVFNASEWGDHICGYAPLYSEEGTYIGAVGVEMQTTDFDAYKLKAMSALGALFFVTTLTLVCSFMFLYWKYSRLQFERIHTDALTQIYNRTYYNNCFIKIMNASRKKASSFVLMIADVDFFKRVNDTFGHEVGDIVLIEIAELLVAAFGRAQVVRFGGEEFVIGFWTKDRETVEKELSLFMDTIRTRKFSSQEIDVTISIGGCIETGQQLDGWLLSEMLKTADGNLYHVKGHGRDNYRIAEFAVKAQEQTL